MQDNIQLRWCQYCVTAWGASETVLFRTFKTGLPCEIMFLQVG